MNSTLNTTTSVSQSQLEGKFASTLAEVEAQLTSRLKEIGSSHLTLFLSVTVVSTETGLPYAHVLDYVVY